MPRLKKIPFSRMRTLSDSGVFIKHFDRYGKTTMRSYSHRDDYYIIVLLTAGAAAVELDFERKEMKNGDILILSPGQVHSHIPSLRAVFIVTLHLQNTGKIHIKVICQKVNIKFIR